jgi:hypothetical protein
MKKKQHAPLSVVAVRHFLRKAVWGVGSLRACPILHEDKLLWVYPQEEAPDTQSDEPFRTLAQTGELEGLLSLGDHLAYATLALLEKAKYSVCTAGDRGFVRYLQEQGLQTFADAIMQYPEERKKR